MSDVITFRDTIRRISPRWLQNGLAGKILYSFGVHLDALGDALVAGVKRRFPGVGSFDSLSLLGKDRKIRRGPRELDTAYADRLLQWLTSHRTRGGPYALLEQVGLFWRTPTAVEFQMWLVYELGRVYTRALGATFGPQDGITQLLAPFDTDVTHWARWWLVFAWPDTIDTDGIWSDPGTWDDDGVWDSDLTLDEVADIRAVPSEWGNAHSFGWVILLSPGGELWDIPAGLWSDPGVWGGSTSAVVLSID